MEKTVDREKNVTNQICNRIKCPIMGYCMFVRNTHGEFRCICCNGLIVYIDGTTITKSNAN